MVSEAPESNFHAGSTALKPEQQVELNLGTRSLLPSTLAHPRCRNLHALDFQPPHYPYIFGLYIGAYKDAGKENTKYYSILVHWGYFGIMETTIDSLVPIFTSPLQNYALVN